MENGLLSIVNASGFPFQIRVAAEILNRFKDHKWVLENEERWWEREDESGFADLVLRKEKPWHEDAINYIVVECKRVTEAAWVFMSSTLSEVQKRVFERGVLGGANDQNVAWWPVEWWNRGQTVIQGPEATYCATPKGRPALERTAGELILATEGIAQQYDDFVKREASDQSHLPALFFPVIVTNAPLYVCKFDVGSVSLEEGQLPYEGTDFTLVDFVRFRKTFKTLPSVQGPVRTMEQAGLANERTVWIVNATRLSSFLKGWATELKH